eukprot:1014719_1
MEKEDVTNTILMDEFHHDIKLQRSIVKNRDYPRIDTPNATFESSNSSNNFNGLPLTPAIATEHCYDYHGGASPYTTPTVSTPKQEGVTAHPIRKHSHASRKSTIIDIYDGESGHSTHRYHRKDSKTDRQTHDIQLLSSKDIIMISIFTLMLSLLAGVMLLLFIVTFGLVEKERSKFALIIIAITFIFVFIIVAICLRINSNFNQNKQELYRIKHSHSNSHHHAHAHRRHRRSSSSNKITSWMKGDLLGCGSFGKVYMALDHSSLQMFVVKQVELIKDNTGNNIFKENIKSIQHEIRTLSKLSHPNIVRYLGSSQTKNHLNIFLEYMSGGSIAGMLNMFGPFELPLIKSYTMQILNGLAFLHSQNIIHRDIKGSNILVNPDGCLKLADFGVCWTFDAQLSINAGGSGVPNHLHKQTLPSSLHGTVHWMAPEVIRQNKYDYKADIYSLGITILEMINGHPPHYNKETISVMFLMMDNVSNDDDANEDSDMIHGGIKLPNELGKYGKALVKQCLKRNPKLRPSSKDLLENHPFLYKQDDIEQDVQEEMVMEIEETNASNVNKLKCINDVKQIVEKKVEYQNKARKELLKRKYKRDIYKKTKKKKYRQFKRYKKQHKIVFNQKK